MLNTTLELISCSYKTPVYTVDLINTVAEPIFDLSALCEIKISEKIVSLLKALFYNIAQ